MVLPFDGNLTQLQYWTQSNLPAVYDDSLSYYELLGKVVNQLNTNTDFSNGVKNILNELINQVNSSKWIDNARLGDQSVDSRVIKNGGITVQDLDPAITSQPTTEFGQQAKFTVIDNHLNTVDSQITNVNNQLSSDASHLSTIDTHLTTVDSQIVSTDKKVEQNKININEVFNKNRPHRILARKGIKPTVTFIDDDTSSQAYNILFNDFVKGKGVPFLFAAISGRIDNLEGSLTKAQFDEMNKHPLVEFGNHTQNHVRLADLSTEMEIEKEIADCDTFLRENGVYTRTLIPPFGSVDQRVYKIAKKYVDTIFVSGDSKTVSDLNVVTDDFLNTEPTVRIDFSKDIEDIKQAIRWAYDKNGWLIIATHSHYPQNPLEPLNFIPSKLTEVINYCIGYGVTITSYSTAYERFKNVIEYRDEDSKMIVGLSAGGFSKGLSEGFFTPRSGNPLFKVYATDPPSVFPQHSFTKNYFTSAEAVTYGFPSAGTLFTSTTNNDGYAYQEFMSYGTNQKLTRYWTGAAWSIFIDVSKNVVVKKVLTINSLAANTSTQYTASSSAFLSGDSLLVNPNFALPSGVVFSGFVESTGTVKVNIYNGSAVSVNLGANEWIFRLFR